jgi:hypothetical protein
MKLRKSGISMQTSRLGNCPLIRLSVVIHRDHVSYFGFYHEEALPLSMAACCGSG